MAVAPRARVLAPGGRYGMGRGSERRVDRGRGREGIGREEVDEGDERIAYAYR